MFRMGVTMAILGFVAAMVMFVTQHPVVGLINAATCLLNVVSAQHYWREIHREEAWR